MQKCKMKEILTVFLLTVSVLNESTERSQSSSWTNHDHWNRWFEGQAELTLAHKDGSGWFQVFCWLFELEPAGCYTLLMPSSFGCVFDEDCRYGHIVRINLKKKKFEHQF
jgi:hypothetical protein